MAEKKRYKTPPHLRWHRTNFQGVRYKIHATRKHGVNFDRYFALSYRLPNQKMKSEGLGWASFGWTAQKASKIYAELRHNHRMGTGPFTFKEMRALELEKRERVEAKKAQAQTLVDFFQNAYLPKAIESKKPSTIIRERSFFNNWIVDVLGSRKISEITSDDLNSLKRIMKKGGKAPRTIELCLSICRRIFNEAIKAGVFKGINPTMEVDWPKFDNAKQRFLTPDEESCLLTALEETSPQTRGMVILSIDTGLRRSEVFNLTWQRIDLHNRLIHAVGTKNYRNRQIPMTTRVHDLFQGMQPGKPSEPIFKNRSGGKLKNVSDSFRRAVDKCKLNAGVKDRLDRLTWHSLRHTCASRLVQRGVALAVVQKILGHHSIQMTERYSHLAPKNLQAAIEKLEGGE